MDEKKTLTVGEAKQTCARIESLYRVQTEEIKEERLRSTLHTEITRKYTI